MAAIIVDGLRDGIGTISTTYLSRKIREFGAKVHLASTGRVTITTYDGKRRVYVLAHVPRNAAEADAIRARSRNSPMTQAIEDLAADMNAENLAATSTK
jgi:hypothetical protein